MSSAPIHQDILSNDKIDHAGAILAKESISQAPKGTHVLQSGKDTSLPTFALVRANLLRNIIPDFQRSISTREAEKHARPFRLTDVPAERFANAVRVNTGENKRAKSGYDAVDEHGTQKRKKSVMYEDTNYIGVANLQIYAFFGLTAASGLGTVLILASLKKMPQLIFALPFALFSGWQMYGYYLSTKAAAEQATKVQFLRMVQGGLEDDPDRQSKFVKKPEKKPISNEQEKTEEASHHNNIDAEKKDNEKVAEKQQQQQQVPSGEVSTNAKDANEGTQGSDEGQYNRLRQTLSIPSRN